MEATILAATLMTIPQTFPQENNNNATNDSTQKTMNEFEITDWIDDILDSEDDDDGLVYEDMYYETIDTQPTGDVQWAK